MLLNSIRGRLQLWYGLVLVAVSTASPYFCYHSESESVHRDLDGRLESAAHYLEIALRSLPPPISETDDDRRPHRPDPLFGRPIPPRDRAMPPDAMFPPPLEREDIPPKRRRTREQVLAEISLPPETGPKENVYFVLWNVDDSVLKSSGLTDVPAPLGLDTFARHPELRWQGNTREATILGPQRVRILVGRDVTHELAYLRRLAWTLGLIGALVLVVGLVGGWFISALIVRPIARISTAAASISANNLSRRIHTASVDRELTNLAGVLNDMFARLESAFERQTRFTADASHELRTPLAILRSHTELALSRSRSEPEYREALDTVLRATQRMTALVEGLLILARADAGKLEMRQQPVDLSEIVSECIEMIQPLARAKDVRVEAEVKPVALSGDPMRLAQVITNLTSNAIQYNRPGGKVGVRLHQEMETAWLIVADTGCGIPEADQPHLFERFFRVDKARARSSGGNGLGLAICKSIVEAHGGTIDFTSKIGQGTTFRVRLPVHSDAEAVTQKA